MDIRRVAIAAAAESLFAAAPSFAQGARALEKIEVGPWVATTNSPEIQEAFPAA